MNKKLRGILLSGAVAVSLAVTGVVGQVVVTNYKNNSNIFAASDSSITLDDMPSEYRESIEWVYNNRVMENNLIVSGNLIFDQIFAGDGTLNYVVRWQSDEVLTLSQREDIKDMLNRQINNWCSLLIDYDGWPYEDITVNIVGWAVNDESIIQDPTDEEIIYTDTVIDSLSETDSSIPNILPTAPSDLSRVEHYEDANYTYGGNYDNRFDMYLWATTNFDGGAGSDWGQRLSDMYLLDALYDDEIQILEHEIGHGFALPDFYEDDDWPPMGFPCETIMMTGDSDTISEWDCWLLRYIWSQIKDTPSRFVDNSDNDTDISDDIDIDNISDDSEDNMSDDDIDYVDDENINDNEYSSFPYDLVTNVASYATTSCSYCSPWETMDALNNGYTPTSSEDRGSLVYGNWPYTGTQWVQYTFSEEYTITSSSVYWFYDGTGIDLPSASELQYLDETGNWITIDSVDVVKDYYNMVNFDPIVTTALRLNMTASEPFSTGIIQWQVFGVAGDQTYTINNNYNEDDYDDEYTDDVSDEELSSEVIFPEGYNDYNDSDDIDDEDYNDNLDNEDYDNSDNFDNEDYVDDDFDDKFDSENKPDLSNDDADIASEILFSHLTFDNFNLGKIKENLTLDGLSINASESNYVTIKNQKKTINDTTYQTALSLNGTGNMYARSVSFKIDSPCTIRITAASSGAATRPLCICNIDGEIISTLQFTASGDMQTFEYCGNGDTLTLYSQNNGINIFEIDIE